MTVDSLTIEQVKDMTLVQLKTALKARGVIATGNKAVLVERLGEYVNNLAPAAEKPAVVAAPTAAPVVKPVTAAEPKPVVEPTPVVVETPAADEPETEENGDKEAVEEKTVTALERQVARAERFGTQIPAEAKKEQRAHRFGTTVESTISPSVGKDSFTSEAKAKRAARFGLAVDAASENKPTGDLSDAQKRRSERFGTTEMTKTGKIDLSNTMSEVMKKRQARFGAATTNDEVEIKKGKRAERFSS